MYGTSVNPRHIIDSANLAGTYEIEAKLGSGGCGSVYKAWHKRLHKYLVLKELDNSTRKTVEVRRNEIEALKNVKHMYIPQVFDYISEDDRSFTVMEYIEGESLDKLLQNGAVFAAPVIAKWYYQLATALDTLHKNDVCHRDIKPGNIILMPGGDVCLIDFNSALVSGNNTKVISRSIGYASPEQHAYFQLCDDIYRKNSGKRTSGAEYISKKRACQIDWKLSDIYNLGATMYHLLTGQRPRLYDTIDPADSLVADADIKQKHSPVQVSVMRIIERSTRVKPEHRYASSAELCSELQKLLK